MVHERIARPAKHLQEGADRDKPGNVESVPCPMSGPYPVGAIGFDQLWGNMPPLLLTFISSR